MIVRSREETISGGYGSIGYGEGTFKKEEAQKIFCGRIPQLYQHKCCINTIKKVALLLRNIIVIVFRNEAMDATIV